MNIVFRSSTTPTAKAPSLPAWSLLLPLDTLCADPNSHLGARTVATLKQTTPSTTPDLHTHMTRTAQRRTPHSMVPRPPLPLRQLLRMYILGWDPGRCILML